MTPILLSWSGGKDAAWALHVLRQRSDVEVIGLLTTVTEGLERISMQGIKTSILEAQSQAVGLPVVQARLPQRADNAAYESVFATALEDARSRWPDLCHIAFGDLFLADIKAYRDALCNRLGWTTHYPLFGSDTAVLAREMIAGGLRAQLCCVDTMQLDARFAGRPFGTELLNALPPRIDPCGEHGEFHTCVSDGPMFTAPINITRGDTVLRDERFAYTDFELVTSGSPARTPAT